MLFRSMDLIIVDLPAPDGPNNPTIWPLETSKLTELRASVLARLTLTSWNFIDTVTKLAYASQLLNEYVVDGNFLARIGKLSQGPLAQLVRATDF